VRASRASTGSWAILPPLRERGDDAILLAQRYQERGEGEPHLFRLPNEGVALDDLEMSLVRQALERSGGNQTRAAELLSISRDQFRLILRLVPRNFLTTCSPAAHFSHPPGD